MKNNPNVIDLGVYRKTRDLHHFHATDLEAHLDRPLDPGIDPVVYVIGVYVALFVGLAVLVW